MDDLFIFKKVSSVDHYILKRRAYTGCKRALTELGERNGKEIVSLLCLHKGDSDSCGVIEGGMCLYKGMGPEELKRELFSGREEGKYYG